MSYTVTVRVDSGPFTFPGHVWYEVSDGTSTYSYGLHPLSRGELLINGVIRPVAGNVKTDDGQTHDLENTTSRTYEITQEQFDALKSQSQADVLYPPDYDLNDSSCVDYTRNALESIGIDIDTPIGNEDTPAGLALDLAIQNVLDRLQQMADFISEQFEDLIEGISELTDDLYNSALNWRERRDPLVLDLDGDGIETTGANATDPVLFDHDGDGIKNGTGWVSSDDGFLVMDRNGNGVIDSGQELFGDSTPLANGTAAADGFAALADLDSNSDGVINSSDAQFADLRVWRDLNQDGISQAGELLTLAEAGVAALNLEHTDGVEDLGNGNTIGSEGTFVRTDGTTSAMDGTDMADLNLIEDTFHREFTDMIPLAEGVTDLPNMQGSGMVRDLWEAASLSSDLKVLLEAYSIAATREEQMSLLDELIFAWGATSTMQTSIVVSTAFTSVSSNGQSSGVTAIEAFKEGNPALYEMITALERFNGRTFLAGRVQTTVVAAPAGGAATASSVMIASQQEELLLQAYESLKESVYNSLVIQTRLKSLLDMIVLVPDAAGTGLVLDFTDVESELQNRIQADAVNGMADLLDFVFATKDQLAGTSWNGWELVEQNLRSLPITPELEALYAEFGVQFSSDSGGTLSGTSEQDILIGKSAADSLSGNGGSDVLYGGAGTDTLRGNDGNDVLDGGIGNDNLDGDAGGDTLDGGAGNDHLSGDGGSDTYLFGRGDGQDTLYNYDTSSSRYDVLQFKADVAVGDVQLIRSSNNLIIKISGTTDQVTVQSFFVNDGSLTSYALNAIQFSDGTSWDLATIKTLVLTGTTGADTLTGYATNDVLSGLDGNDTLSGNAGNDTLDGGAGTDTMAGGAGDDTYYVDATGDVTTESSNGGIDLVNSSVTRTLSSKGLSEILCVSRLIKSLVHDESTFELKRQLRLGSMP